MKFDWLRFCEQFHIPYVTRGPNVARNHLGLHCPWCGDADPSHHLGLSLDVDNPAWGCFRNPQHRGRDPRRLVQKLLKCSFDRALALVQEHNVAVTDDFEGLQLGQPVSYKVPPVEPLTFPKEFRDFSRASHFAHPFLDYVSTVRGFGQDGPDVCKRYQLRYAVTGDYAGRIIVPVYDVDGQLRNWVGRAISPTAHLRYKNAGGSGKDLLFNEPRARKRVERGATVLFVVEGPWDCIKVDYYGTGHGAAAVATLGTSVTTQQVARLAGLSSMFAKTVLLMDVDAFSIGLLLESELSGLSPSQVVVGTLPEGVRDPGELSAEQVDALVQKFQL